MCSKQDMKAWQRTLELMEQGQTLKPFARDGHGKQVSEYSRSAKTFSVYGALARAAREELHDLGKEVRFLKRSERDWKCLAVLESCGGTKKLVRQFVEMHAGGFTRTCGMVRIDGDWVPRKSNAVLAARIFAQREIRHRIQPQHLS